MPHHVCLANINEEIVWVVSEKVWVMHPLEPTVFEGLWYSHSLIEAGEAIDISCETVGFVQSDVVD